MEIVYIETTIVSLLAANPNPDLLIAAQQQATHAWWERRRSEFLCITSDETRFEAARGDTDQANRRLEALAELPSVAISQEIEMLAADFLRTRALPINARSDAIHLAAATIARADYLLTWNCRHLANAQILRRLERAAAEFNWVLPTVCTPFELMGDSFYEDKPDS